MNSHLTRDSNLWCFTTRVRCATPDCVVQRVYRILNLGLGMTALNCCALLPHPLIGALVGALVGAGYLGLRICTILLSESSNSKLSSSAQYTCSIS